MVKNAATPFMTRSEIDVICKSLGAQITKDYKDKDLILVCVLKGAVIFLADLCRYIDLPLKIDFVRLSSYGGSTKSSGIVNILKDISMNIENKHVLIIEEIVDTGRTLNFLCNHLLAYRPASLKLCSLLDKPSRRVIKLQPDYCGKVIEDKFIIGYGLDLDEKCRNYPDIYFIEET
jgi:hypoxanthine phosphoribosyltransferase